MKKFIVLALLLLCFAVVGCRKTQPIQNFTDQAIPAGASQKELTADQVRSAIIRGGAERNWVMRDDGPGVMRGSLDVRGKHHAEVRIPYSAKSYSIEFIGSTGLAQNGNSIHPQYNNWVIYLNQSIQKYLSME